MEIEGLSWNDPGRFAMLNLMNVGLKEKEAKKRHSDDSDSDEETKPKVKKFEADKLFEENLRKVKSLFMIKRFTQSFVID